MPKASEAIFKANQEGRMGLIIYAIPNFPDPESYAAVLEDLESNLAVSVLETTFPVANRYSEYANETIRNAHEVALKHCGGLAAIDHLRDFSKPTICVLYQATFDDEGFENVLDYSQGILDGVLFEWELETEFDTDVLAEERSIELIHCAGSYMTETEVDETLSKLPKGALIYFESAEMTGAEMADLEEMRKFAKLLKSKRPDVCLAAGFGVKTADDIKRLGTIKEMNAVIIGTAFLQASKGGRKATQRFIDSITAALKR